MARPTSFKPEYVEQARALCEHGLTDRELAQIFKTTEQTLNRWKQQFPEFREALKLGKEAADTRVEKALYHRAIGYSFEAVKILHYQGKPVVVPYVEHVPPDTTACIFWLKNRKRDEWRDRIEHTGDNGGPLKIDISVEWTPPKSEQAA